MESRNVVAYCHDEKYYEPVNCEHDKIFKIDGYCEVSEWPIYQSGGWSSSGGDVKDQRKTLLNKFHTLKQEFSSCKFELNDHKNTKALNLSYQCEITKLCLENESLKDEIFDLKKVIEKWTSSRATIGQLLIEQVLGNISDVSTSETYLEIPFHFESEVNSLRPLPSLPKLNGAEPSGNKKCIAITKTKHTTNKVVPVNVKQQTETKSPHDSPTKKLLFTLMQEVKSLRKQIQTHSETSPPTSQSGSSRSSKACEKGKHHRASFKTKRSFFINKCLYLLRMDLFGPVKSQTISHNKYTLVIVDEYSRKMENLNEVKVKKLRSDNETEFKNLKLEEFYDEKGVSQNLSSHCTPEQYGAINTACYTQNISMIVKRHGKMAYDVFRGRSPDISYFHMFGCPVHIRDHIDHLGKFDEKADDGYFLGYSPVAKAFRMIAYAFCWGLDIDIAGKDYVNENLFPMKSYQITYATFKPSFLFEVPLTTHMCKVVKLSEKPLIHSPEEVNAEDTNDKSLSRTYVHHVSQSKAKTNKKLRKKKILSLSKPKVSKTVRVQTRTPQASESQPAEETEVTADATQSLEASKLVEDQENQPQTANTTKFLQVQEKIVKEGETNIEDDVELIDSDLHSIGDVTLKSLNEPADESPYDTVSEIKVIKSIFQDDYDLESMLGDEIGLVSESKTSAYEEDDIHSPHKELSNSEERDADNIIKEMDDMNAFDEKPSLSNPFTHLRNDLNNLTTKEYTKTEPLVSEQNNLTPKPTQEEQQPFDVIIAKKDQSIEQPPSASEEPPTTKKASQMTIDLVIHSSEIKTKEETSIEDEPLSKRPRRQMTVKEVKAQIKERKRLELLKAEKEESEKQLLKMINPTTVRAQTLKLAEYEAKRLKMIREYNDCITKRLYPLLITKINYTISKQTKEATMRITRDNDLITLSVYERFGLKM
nr:hypothetical protein [Tanacetum cinerariifolium]